MIHKVLLIEDEANLATVITEGLTLRGFQVSWKEGFNEGLNSYFREKPDAVVLDVMLPDGDGFQLARLIRNDSLKVPVIFLTARSLPQDVIAGFESGGNDYLKKPFSLEELIIRIRALLARNRTLIDEAPVASQSLKLGTYEFFPNECKLIYKQGITTILTARESQLLEILALRLNQMVERKFLLMKVWDQDDFFAGRSLDVFITRLRKHLQLDDSLRILNIRAKGYKLIASRQT